MLGHILLLLGPLGTEETMKRRWRVRREAVERPDGQGRWDQAYQAILLWSLENEQGHGQKLALRARTARRSTMRVAAYVRVSTSRQVKLETIEQQLEMVSRYAREQGWELPEEDIFRDDGYSATTLGRPALDALRDKARLRGRGRRGALPG
jgi:hypothetical protein